MKRFLVAVAVAVGIVSAVFLCKAGYFHYTVFENNDRTLAKNLTVSNEWTELKIDPMVSPIYGRQAIYLRPLGLDVDVNAKGFAIELPDGTVVEPEVEILDEHGNVFRLQKAGFALGSEDEVEYWPRDVLPGDRRYNSLRIRSDVSFTYQRIRWIDYSPK